MKTIFHNIYLNNYTSNPSHRNGSNALFVPGGCKACKLTSSWCHCDIKRAIKGYQTSLAEGFVWLLTAEDGLDVVRGVGESVSVSVGGEAAFRRVACF